MNNDFHTRLPCSQRGSGRLGLFDGFSRWFVFLGFTALVSCGTSKLFKELGAEQNEISRETTRFAGMTRKEVEFSWSAAKERLLREDIGLQQSAARLADISRQRKNQWREWLPRPSFYVSLQNSFKQLGNLTNESLSSAFYAPLTIPNPWTQTAKAYQYALQEAQATDSMELLRRRQIIMLYRSFSEWERLDDSVVKNQTETIEEQLQGALRNLESESMLDERRQLYQGQFSRLLNLPGVAVIPLPATLPKIDYEHKLSSMIPGKNYGELATRLSSYEIEAAILRRKGIRINQWSALNFNTGVPPIYNSRDENSQFINSNEDITLFGSWSKSFDFTGSQAADVKSAEDNVALVHKTLKINLDAEGRKWDRLRSRYKMLVEKREFYSQRMAKVLHDAGRVGLAEKSLEDARRLFADLKNLERAKQDLDLEIWLWDDKAWN